MKDAKIKIETAPVQQKLNTVKIRPIFNRDAVPVSAGLRTNSVTAEMPSGTNIYVNELYDKNKIIIDTFYSYPWLNATVNSIAKTLTGANIRVVPTDSSSKIDAEKRDRITRFLSGVSAKKDWNNIKDLIPVSNKLYMTIVTYILLGQASWEVLYDGRKAPIGYDLLYGLTIPNVDNVGNFKDPAFQFYTYNDINPHMSMTAEPVEFDKYEVVYFVSPSISGDMAGRTYIESLINYTIPADLYAAQSYLNLHKNRTRPNGLWILPENIDDDLFEQAVQNIDMLYKGAERYGSSSAVVRGELDFKEFSNPSKDDMPYIQGREYSMNEVSVVTGVPAAKLGVADAVGKANLQELKREFYESTIKPLAKVIEETMTEQIVLRLFDYEDVKIKFEEPDFMKAVERSAVARRYWEMGALNPNQIREKYLQEPPREGGDKYFDRMAAKASQANLNNPEPAQQGQENQPNKERGGSPKDTVVGSGEQQRKPGDVGHSNAESTQNLGKTSLIKAELSNVLNEVSKWERFMLNMINDNKKYREFSFNQVPPALADSVNSEMEYFMRTYSDKESRLYGLSLISSLAREVLIEFFDVAESV